MSSACSARAARMNNDVGELSSQRLRGVLFVVAASACFAALDAIAKLLAERYSPLMVAWARYFFHIAVMAVFLGPTYGRALMRTRRPAAQVARGTMLALSSIVFFSSLAILPQAEATAIISIAPVLVTLGAVYWLKERAPPGSGWALALSFAGVLLIVRPGGEVFGWGALLAMMASIFASGYSLLTRMLASSDDTMATLFIGGIVATGILSLLLPFVFEWPHSLFDLLLMITTGCFGAFGHLLLLRGYARVTASTVAPFTYSHAVFALATGAIVFQTFPDLIALTGMALIVSTGVVMALRRR